MDGLVCGVPQHPVFVDSSKEPGNLQWQYTKATATHVKVIRDTTITATTATETTNRHNQHDKH